MKYNFKLYKPNVILSQPSEVGTNSSNINENDIYPKYIADHIKKNTNYKPGLIYINFDSDEFKDAKLITDANETIGWKWTTISYLNEHLNFNDIEYVTKHKRRDEDITKLNYENYKKDDPTYDRLSEKYKYLPDNNINQLLTDMTHSISLEEFNRKYQSVLFYEKLLDKDYYTKGLYTIGNNEVSSDDIIISDNRYFIKPYAFLSIQNVTYSELEELEAYLWIRGVPIRMKEYITSYNQNNTYNYIIEYPDYLLESYYENYKSVDYIELINAGNNIKVYKADNYNLLITDDNFINISSNKYDVTLAPLNIIQ